MLPRSSHIGKYPIFSSQFNAIVIIVLTSIFGFARVGLAWVGCASCNGARVVCVGCNGARVVCAGCNGAGVVCAGCNDAGVVSRVVMVHRLFACVAM